MFKFALLSLLAAGRNRYGYELRARFEELFAGMWAVNVGQVYTTLSRLERDALVTSAIDEQDDRPDRRVYALTAAGRRALDAWLTEPVEDPGRMKDEFFLKLLAHWLQAADATAFVNQQRQRWYEELAELADRRTNGGVAPITELVLEGAMLRLEADLRWLDTVERRLSSLGPEPAPRAGPRLPRRAAT